VLAQLRSNWRTLAIAFLIFYFAFHALAGDGGLLTWSKRNEMMAARAEELKQLKSQRADMEARALLLRNESLSQDLLEERARSLLGFSDPRDYVVRKGPHA
jgi:cell division protein FtsB